MFIYKITNLINGKTYIGQTVNNPLYRWQQHCSAFHNTKSLVKDAIKKYGKSNFQFEVLGQFTEETLDYNEIKFIKQFNSLVPNGYNLTTGGTAKHRFSEQSKQLQRLAKLGKKASEETKLKMSKAQKGKVQSEQTKKKISDTHKQLGYSKGITPANATPIYGYNPKTEQAWFFKSITEATKYGFDISNISTVCHGRLKTHKGFQWRFLNA